MDQPSNPPDHGARDQPSGHSGRSVIRYQQWLPILGSAFWEAFLLNLGDPPPLPFPEGSHGETEPHTDHRHRLVCPPRFHLLAAVGEDRSFHFAYTESSFPGAMRRKLLI